MEEIMNLINVDEVTLEDCLTLYDMKNMCTIINDGIIKGFVADSI